MLEPEKERALAGLFRQALDLPAEQRPAFVERVAGDDAELGRRLAELIAQDVEGTRGVLAADARGAHDARLRVGPYRLLRLLGEGGMGSVHLAEQDEPVRRTVALKTIRVGGGAEVLARFDAECQALARLEHPNVASIHESGVTDSGLPWFAMEYCPGRPLDEHCDHERLSIADRLRLLLPVCSAVHHAHLRGILHRDLKPANVLVTQRDNRSVPKVIDFGLARGVAGSLSSQVSPSDDDRPLGTWLYMSPEQADPRGDVDARTDVWALGAMLCELLSGQPPFAADSVPAVAARLASEQPRPPSEILAALDPARAREVALQRRTTPPALMRRLRGDLDAICLRALERDRTRRYSTPSELADDLRSHLACEPVSAVRSTAVYQLGKLVRRRKGSTLLALLAAAALVGGLSYGWRQAALARDAQIARRDNLQRSLARTAIRSEFLQNALLEVSDPDVSLRELLALAEPRIEALHGTDPLAEAAVRRSLGTIWLDLGEDDRARVQLDRAWVLVSGSEQADDIERFLTLDALIRARRAERMAVEAELVEQSVHLALRLLEEQRPPLSRALERLFAQARSSSSGEDDVRVELDTVADLLSSQLGRREETLLVSRVLSEATVALHRAGRAVESDRLSRSLEELARRTFDPNGSAWLYFLWRAADAHLKSDPALADRASELTEELLRAASRRGLDEDHWMLQEAWRLRAESQAARPDAER